MVRLYNEVDSFHWEQHSTDTGSFCRHYCEKEDENGHTVRSAGRRILPEKIKEEFRGKQLVCYEFMNLTDAQERDLFQRVQKGIQLTKAEQFRATRGDWQTFAEMYERDFPKVVNRMSPVAYLCVLGSC